MRWLTCVTRRFTSAFRTSTNSWMPSTHGDVESNQTRFNGNCFLLRQRKRMRTSAAVRAWGQSKIIIAFKEEFPYLRTTSGQLFEFNRDWLHAAITRAADEAGYPGWWLTDHVTESIAFYLHLRNDENVVAFNQLSQTVRDVLAAIGYKEIGPHFTPAPPPICISLLDIAHCAGASYELAFFGLLEKRISALIDAGADNLRLSSLQLCVKHLRGTKTWTRACDALREEIVCFVREKLTVATDHARLDCSLR